MKPDTLKDQDIADLFASLEHYDDAEVFEDRVMRRLRMRLWLRQWLVVLAGFIGGIYALAQFIRVPDGRLNSVGLYRRAAADTDQTLRAGAEIVDGARRGLIDLVEQSGGYLSFMQTPVFFALSFVLCLIILGLYYAYAQEEAL